jgi:PAS domain S-box-containing protein
LNERDQIHLLHVDDNDDDHFILNHKMRLLIDNLTVKHAKSVENCIELLGSKNYDCLICDYQMPGKNGLDLLEHLQQTENDMPVIFLTGQGNEVLTKQVLEFGAADYFPKDTSFAHYTRLANSIVKAIEAHRSKKESQSFQKALDYSEDQFRTIFNELPTGVVLSNIAGELIYCNDALAQMLGYTKEELIDTQVADIYAFPQDREQIIGVFSHGGQLKNHHMRTKKKDGAIVETEISMTSCKLGGENLLLTVFEDISERMEAQRKLSESEYKYKLLTENQKDVVFSFSIQGIMQYCSPSFLEFGGYNSTEEVGESIEKYLADAEDYARVKKKFFELIKFKDPVEIHIQFKPKYGKVFPVEIYAKLVKADNKNASVQGMMRDISSRAALLEPMLNRGEKYRTLFEKSGDAMLIIEDGNFVDCNEATVEMLRADNRSQILNTHPSELSPAYQPNGQESFLEADKQIELALLNGNHRFEWNHKRIDGEVFPVEVLLTAVKENGKPILYTTWRDISERKENQKRREEFEQLAEKRSNELQASHEELKAFSYSISHDLKAPLRQITQYSLLLKDQLGTSLDQETGIIVDRLTGKTDKMTQMIDDMMHLSQISKYVLQPVEIDLAKISDKIFADLKESDPERSIQLKKSDTIPIVADEGLLTIAINNLIGNAWKFTRNSDDAIIEVGVMAGENGEIFYVKDNGAGFISSKPKEIFLPFKRMHSDSEFEGSGIGLATVHRIIKRHHGKIWAEAEEGKGASFFFTLQ